MNIRKTYGLSVIVPAIVCAFILGLLAHFIISPSRNSSASISSTGGASTVTGSSEVTTDQFSPFWKAWDILNSKYVEATTTKDQTKIYGAIKGLTASFGDPYTVFFPPAESKMFQEDIAGDFGGIGMEIGVKDGVMIVVSPLKGSPAEAAGVKTGDAIIKINGTSTSDMSVDEAVSSIRGPKGTKVKITFLSKNSTKPVELTITRDIIKIPTLDTDSLPGGIFVIKLYSFTADSPNLFNSALRTFILSGDQKLIIDLRGNPGGYLEAAVDMASRFLPSGKVIVTEDFGANQPQNVFRSKLGYQVFTSNLHPIILVNGGSASAAEILAGALSENGVAKLVGSKTFGKGSVQELIQLTPDTSLKVTVARWLTPNGHNLSHDGLDPDYPVSASSTEAVAGKDPVMDKAVQLLNQ